MNHRAYVCAKAIINDDGSLVVVDARIYSSPAFGLTTLGNKEIYLQVYECAGVSYDSAHDNAYRSVEAMSRVRGEGPYKVIFDFLKKNEEAMNKHLKDHGML